MGAIENMKEVADLVKKFNDIELNRKILTLETEVIDLTRDKRRLENRVEEMDGKLKFKQELEFKEPFFWLKDDNTPYCPSCWELKSDAIHVVFGFQHNGRAHWSCRICKSSFDVMNNNPAFRNF